MKKRKTKTASKFWQAGDIDSLELLHARFVNHRFSKHAHEEYVIGVIEKGAEGFNLNGTHHTAPEGSIIAINPDTVHTGYAVMGNSWMYRMMYPKASLLKRVSESLRDKEKTERPYFPTPVISDAPLAEKIYHLHRILEQSHIFLERQVLFSDIMNQLIMKHAKNRPEIRKIKKSHIPLDRVCEYIHSHYFENMALKQLADIVHLSPFYFSRIFQKRMGISPHAYMIQIRINHAKKAIRNRDSLSDVAALTGFYDQSHLNRHFRKIVGISPGQFARHCSNGKISHFSVAP